MITETEEINIELPEISIHGKKEDSRDIYLFVCTGNTCRSPMCAALFNDRYAGKDRHAMSAGLAADGSPISQNAVIALAHKGIKSTGDNNYLAHISRTVTEEMMQKASVVIGVSERHARSLLFAFPQYASKITSLPKGISDPFGGDVEQYEKCLDDIEKALEEKYGHD